MLVQISLSFLGHLSSESISYSKRKHLSKVADIDVVHKCPQYGGTFPTSTSHLQVNNCLLTLLL